MEYKVYMQNIFLKNLREIRQGKKITQRTLAKKVKVDQSYISKLEKCTQAGDLTLAHRLSDALGVTIERLTGKVTTASSIPPLDIRVIWEPGKIPLKEPLTRLEGKFLPIPIYNVNVVGGDPETIAREEVEDVALIHRASLQRKTTRGLVCTHVHGDSMIPILRDGAIVCIDTAARPERGKVPKGSVWAIRKDDGVIVKHLQLTDGALVLISANPAYGPEVIINAEAIVGRVIWVWQGL